MYKQLRGPEKIFRIGQWIVAVLFAYFLINIGADIIADLPLASKQPVIEDFLDQAAIRKIEAQIQPELDKIKQLDQEISARQTQLNDARANHLKARESFENWNATRKSTERSEENPEVITRARQLDQSLQAQRNIETAIQALSQKKADLLASIAPQQKSINDLHADADKKLDKALYWNSLKIFSVRLCFVLPLLAVGAWALRKYRKTEHWPFAWGFAFFALFAFFFELVPYLPRFGSYIRFGVGAILTFWGGRALIRALQRYIERKKQEQAIPQEERKQEIRYEKALESIAKNQCPSCERAIPAAESAGMNFCMHCGLKIFKNCAHCGLRHNSFYLFCPACGVAANATK